MSEVLQKLLAGQEENHILPFFWQHGEDEATLREYVNVIYNANIRAICVESRPHPDYCGPKWWQDMDAIIDESKKLGMKVWILDDAHFPTGFANGSLKEAPAELRRQSLVVQYVEAGKGSEETVLDMSQYQEAQPWTPSYIEGIVLQGQEFKIFEDDKLVSVVAIKDGGYEEDVIDLTDTCKDGKIVFKAPDDGAWKIAIVHLTRNRGPHRDYMNMMDMASSHKLIEAVYEPHFEHYGDEFGKTIAGFFSDEPEIGNGHLYEFGKKIGQLDDQAWSDAIGERLKAKWGKDYGRFLPLIWEQTCDKDLQARVRCDYMDAISLEVKKCFSMQVGDWCRAHGVKYIGHLIEDDHQHSRTCSSLGHYFRGLAGQDWAGIDDIGGQILPQREDIGPGDFMHPERDGEFWHYTLGKLGASMAAIDPLKHGSSMCEIFGNYGWSEGVRLEKYLADHLMVRGINNYVPHAFTPAPFPDPDCPPHFYAHGHNPQYRHFGELMIYMNRICTLISGGKAVIPAAILYNAEADWAGDFMYMQKPAIQLYDHQIDYHIVPADIFMDAKTADPARQGLTDYKAVLSDTLTVGEQEYRALIVPYMEYMVQAAAEGAVKLAENGCTVVFVGDLPHATIEGGKKDPVLAQLKDLAAAGKIIVCGLSDLAEKLIGKGVCDAAIAPASNRIRVYHYQQDKDLYYIVNEAAEAYTGSICVGGVHTAAWYDAWNNTLTDAGTSDAFAFTLDPSKSLILVIDEAAPAAKKAEGTENRIDLMQGWKRSICKSTEYPAFAEEKMIDLPDTLAQELPKFSGFVRYEKTISCDKVPQSAVLTITDAYEGVEVFVNGESLGIQVVPTYTYELAGKLKSGENDIRIEVATTLEREAQDFPSRWAIPGAEAPVLTVPSGINGNVYLSVTE
ncbi:MAG: hypothetical protein IJV14_03480 [Lachnospiraceae bacterium]|nr:hypothetical protein [Lachnospiraceae bacterium]